MKRSSCDGTFGDFKLDVSDNNCSYWFWNIPIWSHMGLSENLRYPQVQACFPLKFHFRVYSTFKHTAHVFPYQPMKLNWFRLVNKVGFLSLDKHAINDLPFGAGLYKADMGILAIFFNWVCCIHEQLKNMQAVFKPWKNIHWVPSLHLLDWCFSKTEKNTVADIKRIDMAAWRFFTCQLGPKLETSSNCLCNQRNASAFRQPVGGQKNTQTS